MERLHLVTIAFNKPRLILEQIRLLRKYLADPFGLWVLDNSSDPEAAAGIKMLCEREGISYSLGDDPEHMHHRALNQAARVFGEMQAEFFGFLDHDVFPSEQTQLLPLIEAAGFHGIGQRAPASGQLYPWPGWFFVSRDWLSGRELDFGGAGGGDTGSALCTLFTEDDWLAFYRVEHGYRALRHPDDVGLQSWGYERLGDWIHLSNGSGWMEIPNPEERERLVFDLLESL